MLASAIFCGYHDYREFWLTVSLLDHQAALPSLLGGADRAARRLQ